MTHILVPATWLIVLLAGLPQLSETVYSPSLPDIARDLSASESMVEYTLTIYLFAFALGTLLWGRLSDRVGRKPCVIAGLLIFILGCVGCYSSTTITMLMISRFIQALGGSVGSVLGQAICRDAFHGPALGKMYSSLGSALAIFPAIGPVVGGLIAERFGWPSIFLFLIAFSLVLAACLIKLLPETHHSDKRKPISAVEVTAQLLKDTRVLGLGLIVGVCNGISFSYFAEGSFYLIKLLGLSPSTYGTSFIALALASMMGGLTSRKLHSRYDSQAIMRVGLLVILGASAVSSTLVVLHSTGLSIPVFGLIGITLLTQMCIMYGICMATTNALALALVDYKWCIGTASSLFGFFYYCVVSLCTFGMGALHNGTLVPMPLYFLSLACGMYIVQKLLINK